MLLHEWFRVERNASQHSSKVRSVNTYHTNRYNFVPCNLNIYALLRLLRISKSQKWTTVSRLCDLTRDYVRRVRSIKIACTFMCACMYSTSITFDVYINCIQQRTGARLSKDGSTLSEDGCSQKINRTDSVNAITVDTVEPRLTTTPELRTASI